MNKIYNIFRKKSPLKKYRTLKPLCITRDKEHKTEFYINTTLRKGYQLKIILVIKGQKFRFENGIMNIFLEILDSAKMKFILWIFRKRRNLLCWTKDDGS